MLKSFGIICLLVIAHLIVVGQRTCGTAAYTSTLHKYYPELGAKNNLLRLDTGNANSLLDEVDSKFEVHVVVNIVLQDTNLITNEQVQSQIDVLNEDFSGSNIDVAEVPYYFKCFVATQTGISFVLDTIIRVKTSVKSFFIETQKDKDLRDEHSDPVKYRETGGIPPTDPINKLNLWVADMNYYENLAHPHSILYGFSILPPVPINLDGVAIHYKYFGRTHISNSEFNKGRTCTHEVGHYFGLVHIWGDAECGDDGIQDTPKQEAATNGCWNKVMADCNHTPNGAMYMNFMDYTADACMHMFTLGQAARMRQIAATFRPSFLIRSGTDFMQDGGILKNLALVDKIVQKANRAIITIDRYSNSAYTKMYIKKAGDSQFKPFTVTDTFITTGLEPSAVYEIKVRSKEHRFLQLKDLPSVYFIPDANKFKKYGGLKIKNKQ